MTIRIAITIRIIRIIIKTMMMMMMIVQGGDDLLESLVTAIDETLYTRENQSPIPQYYEV
jgi:hypothetical protein